MILFIYLLTCREISWAVVEKVMPRISNASCEKHLVDVPCV